jgi:hypothetical protein
MIVGLLTVRQRRLQVAGVDRMTIEQVVRKALVEDHADVIRESVRWVAQQMMESEVSDPVGHEGWGDRVADPQAQAGQLLPELSAAAKAL